jgi:hypothetical protein
MTFSIDVIDGGSLALRNKELALSQPGECRLSLTCVDGASAILVLLRRDGVVETQAEIDSQGGECTSFTVRRTDRDRLYVECDDKHRILLLAPHDPPCLPFLPHTASKRLDLAFLIDGTTLERTQIEEVAEPESGPAEKRKSRGQTAESRQLLGNALRPLIGRGSSWKAIVRDRLGAFARAMAAKYPDTRFSVVAFGDHCQTTLNDGSDLKPSYLIDPESSDQRRFRALAIDRVENVLLNVRPTPGFDFVDGLADGMHACEEIGWREGARKILLVFGGSPGYSLLDPIRDSVLGPQFLDAQVRVRDVDEQAGDLFKRGVEIVTVFHEIESAAEVSGLAEAEQYIKQTRQQYTRLASLEGWVYTTNEFGPNRAEEICAMRPAILGRGACYGIDQ